MHATDDPQPLALEEPTQPFVPVPDNRPVMPEPLPVRLIAVADVRLDALAGVEQKLDDFYVDMLRFERVDGELAYRGENFTLHFTIHAELVVRESLRPLGVEVLSLADAEHTLVQRELAYTRVRGVMPGAESLLLLDPAGNWIEIVESRRIG